MSKANNSKNWIKGHVKDPFVIQAQKDGYRSRAAYKLIEIDNKYKIIKPGIAAADLGAAPGGWSQVLSKVPGGKVLVCQPNTHAVALMGELSARALMVKGTKGYLMDGHCRDVEEIIDAGFPVFCRLTTAADIVERWKYNSLGNPITIGTVTIRSGDYIVAPNFCFLS